MIGSRNGESKVLQVNRLELSLCREVEGVLCEVHVLKPKRKFAVTSLGAAQGRKQLLLLPALVGMAQERG